MPNPLHIFSDPMIAVLTIYASALLATVIATLITCTRLLDEVREIQHWIWVVVRKVDPEVERPGVEETNTSADGDVS